MLGSASIRPAADSAGTRVPRCLTFRRRLGQRENRRKWGFVSGVSLVSANLKLIVSILQWEGISRAIARPAGTGETGRNLARILVRQLARQMRATRDTRDAPLGGRGQEQDRYTVQWCHCATVCMACHPVTAQPNRENCKPK